VIEKQEFVLAHLPGDSQGGRVEIALHVDANVSCVILRQQSWANGIGWFNQSSVTLSSEQVKHLQRALGSNSRALSNRFSSPRSACEGPQAPSVIPFPGVRVRNEHDNA
jgi:hypothetical protein